MTTIPIDSSKYFYSELYKSLDEDASKEKEGVELCLITNQPLTENLVELNCKHKFNYVPLYNDILIHKKTFNRLEKRLLKVNEIRCPYCRNIQNSVLPYYDMAGVRKLNGVNFVDESSMSKFNMCVSNGYTTGTCAFVTHAVTGDEGTTTEVFTCKNKLVKLLELDGKTYCTTHKYQVMKEHEKQQKQKAKEQAKEEKQKAKELAKQEKEQAKQKEKEEKQKAKEQAKQEKQKATKTTKNQVPVPASQDENVVLPLATNGCNYVFKIGAKKGTPCGCKVFQDGTTCKKHLAKEVVVKEVESKV